MRVENQKIATTRASSRVIVVAIVILLVVGGVYLAYSSTRTGTSGSTSPSRSGSSTGTSTTGNGTFGLLSLFGTFSHMTYSTELYDLTEGSKALLEQHNFTYTVLGPGLLNSTEHIKVEFTQAGASRPIIAWFNPQGSVDRADLLGLANYTGSQAVFYATEDFAPLLASVGIPNNSSTLPPLAEVSHGVISLGSTQLESTTYQLAGSTSAYSNVTATFAALPGTGARLLVYLDEVVPSDTETVFQISSLTK